MKQDPAGTFLRWFFWASIAAVVLAVVLSSGGRRLASLMRREFRDAMTSEPLSE